MEYEFSEGSHGAAVEAERVASLSAPRMVQRPNTQLGDGGSRSPQQQQTRDESAESVLPVTIIKDLASI